VRNGTVNTDWEEEEEVEEEDVSEVKMVEEDVRGE
jgi:hypothetical protein